MNGDTDDGLRERYRLERVPAALLAQPDKGKKKCVASQGVNSESFPKGDSKSPFQKQPKPDSKRSSYQAIPQKQECAL